MALLGLLLLPANYRAGAESAHAHSLIQLWTDVSNGTVRHHVDHDRVHPSPGVSSSWFDPSVDVAGSPTLKSLDDEVDPATSTEGKNQEEETPGLGFTPKWSKW